MRRGPFDLSTFRPFDLSTFRPFDIDGTCLPASCAAPYGVPQLRDLLSAGRPRPGILSRNSGIGLLGPRSTGPRMIKPPSQAPFAPLLYSLAPARLTLWVHLRWLQLDHPMVSFQRLGSHLPFDGTCPPGKRCRPLRGPAAAGSSAPLPSGLVPISHIPYPISHIPYPISYIPSSIFRPSGAHPIFRPSILHPPSSILHPPSSILHPSSLAWFPSSSPSSEKAPTPEFIQE
jgi:hypothetical protein